MQQQNHLIISYFILHVLFQVEKVLTGYPASYGGLKVHDFLISVNGQEVFEMNHGQLVKLIKTSGNTMQLAVERWSTVL